MSAGAAEEPAGVSEPNQRGSVTEYRCGGVTVRLPAEPPQLTPQAARTLLKILRELTDEEFSKRSKEADS